ncbi:MAG: hypothetical protein Fur0034_18020 [Desulfuromonadia bacterium]
MGIPEEITKLEQDLERLIKEYERYFLGLEKREPLPLLSSVERTTRTLLSTPITNTMLKFRLNSLALKLSTYRDHWRKTTLQIEEGKYSRDRFKMKLKEKNVNAREIPQTDTDDPAVRLHRKLQEAHQACGISAPLPSVEKLKGIIEKKKPELMAKYRCRDVEFKVVVEGGAPKLKAVPIR